MTLETQTDSALSGYVKEFLLEFKDERSEVSFEESANLTILPCLIRTS